MLGDVIIDVASTSGKSTLCRKSKNFFLYGKTVPLRTYDLKIRNSTVVFVDGDTLFPFVRAEAFGQDSKASWAECCVNENCTRVLIDFAKELNDLYDTVVLIHWPMLHLVCPHVFPSVHVPGNLIVERQMARGDKPKNYEHLVYQLAVGLDPDRDMRNQFSREVVTLSEGKYLNDDILKLLTEVW